MKTTLKNSLIVVSVLLVASLIFDFGPRIHQEVLQAQNLIASQKYEEAALRYEYILKQNPNREIEVKVLYQLGDLYSIYLSQNKKSIKYYQKLLKSRKTRCGWCGRKKESLKFTLTI